MRSTFAPNFSFSNLKLYLALSRTPHGLLDLATPFLTMLLWLGGFPPFWVVCVGLITVFAGYTAVYAVNDIVDFRTDRKNADAALIQTGEGYLDAIFIRHPLAQGHLRMWQAVLWAAFWSLTALVGAWVLNPVCAGLFVLGVLLETIYCKLLTVTYWRAMINGVVKTLGPLAAVLAVDPHPAPWYLLLVFLWVFFWEIGGQNIPADWYDIEMDSEQNARTIPVALGKEKASLLLVGSLSLSLVLSFVLFLASPLHMPLWLALPALAAGVWLCLLPGLRVRRSLDRRDTSVLFNRASYYPAAMLLFALIALF